MEYKIKIKANYIENIIVKKKDIVLKIKNSEEILST